MRYWAAGSSLKTLTGPHTGGGAGKSGDAMGKTKGWGWVEVGTVGLQGAERCACGAWRLISLL